MKTVLNWLFYLLIVTLLLEAIFVLSCKVVGPSHKPGDRIAILNNKSILVDGLPCQTNIVGYISPTGPDGEKSWYRLERPFFPLGFKYSVITEGGDLWVFGSDLIALPAAPDALLCPNKGG